MLSGSAPRALPGSTAGAGLGGPPPPSPYPDWTNTGYQNASGYPGSPSALTDGSSLTITSNNTYSFYYFPNTPVNVGTSPSPVSNVTFYGCRFTGAGGNFACALVYGANITFQYCTFEPNSYPPLSDVAMGPYAPRVSHSAGIDRGVQVGGPSGAGALTIDHCDVWGFGAGFQFAYSTQSAPFTATNNWVHNSRDDGGIDHTDGILDVGTGNSYVVIRHNTITGYGITQALALEAPSYDHLTVTNNYFSGFGYMTNAGATHTGPFSTNVTWTGNLWSAEVEPSFGPLYENSPFTQANAFTVAGNYWAGNKYHVWPQQNPVWLAAGNDGLYWWPADGNPATNSQIIGHAADWANT